ncbi:hypothetical protein [Actinophytocola sp. NPDC049390]|uniref:hypothetical protein n=1 Tax=Actinophytocola sp. NPDC049390 TaxID=3363894 RepID=UPI00379B08BD
MQPNPPPPGFPQYGQPPVAGGILALVTTGMLVWFALHNVVDAAGPGPQPGVVTQNVVGGLTGAGLLLAAAGFTFARKVSGAWTRPSAHSSASTSPTAPPSG